MKKINSVLALAAAAAVVLALAPAVSANCIPAKTAGTFGNADGSYIYIDQGTGNAAARAGQFWQPDLPSAASTAAYPASDWSFIDLGGLISAQANLGNSGVSGCPAGSLAMLVQTPVGSGSNFAVMTINETPAGTPGKINFSYSDLGANAVMVPVPRPRVATSARAGSVVNLTLNFDAVTPGLYGPQASTIMSGFRVVSKEATSDPGRDATLWNGPVIGSYSSTGGALSSQAASVTCSGTTNDVFIATQLLFSSGSIASNLVSDSVRIECDPTIADPGRFKIIDKTKKKGDDLQPRR